MKCGLVFRCSNISVTTVIESSALSRTPAVPPAIAGCLRASPAQRKKRAPLAPIELFGLLFRLSNGDSLTRIAHFEASEAAHRDVFAELANLGGNQLSNGDRLVLNEGLLQQADFFVKLAHLAFDHFFRDV